LSIHLSARSLTAKQIQTVQDFAIRIAEGLKELNNDVSFELRQQILAELRVQAILDVEDGTKTARACCILDKEVLHVASGNSKRDSHVGSPYKGMPCSESRTNGLDACVC